MANSDRGVKESLTSDPTRKQRWPDEVIRYLHLVKHTFENEPNKYHEFLQILAAHKYRRASINCLIARARYLFKEHENLIDGFYQYLPERHRIIHNIAKDFLVEVKARFQHDKEVCRAFLQVLHSYSIGACDALHTLEQAKNLFKGHPDLIEKYQRYLPGSVILAQSRPTDKKAESPRLQEICGEIEDSVGYLQRIKERFQDQQETYHELLMIMKDFKSKRTDILRLAVAVMVLIRGNPDLIQGFYVFLPEEYWMDEEKALDFDQAADLIVKIKNGLQHMHDGTLIWPFLEVLTMYYKDDDMTLQDFYREIKVLLRNHPDLLEELTPFSSDLHSGGTSPKSCL